MKILAIIFLMMSSAAAWAQVLEVSREKNAVLINKYLAARNSTANAKISPPLVIPPANKYEVRLTNVKVPVEFTYVYFSYVLKPKNNVFRLYRPSSSK